MVKKLFKHEIIYYFRTFGLFLPIVLVAGVMTRVFFALYDYENIINEILLSVSTVMLVMSCFALWILSGVISIVRFYKNMYSSEGYLTLTLPVTNSQHIFVKLISTMVWEITCFFTGIASLIIAFSGMRVDEPGDDVFYPMDMFLEEIGAGNLIGYLIELLILALVAMAYSTLLFYACITVGQTARKNRILKAVAAYFIYYMVTQVISTVINVVVISLGVFDVLDGLLEWFSANATAVIHVIMCGTIVFSSAVCLVFWLVIQYIMSKKLNLE